MKFVPLTDRFWAKVDTSGECWEWLAGITQSGYGHIRASRERRELIAHRVSWEIHFGPIPAGLQVLHRCDNRRCVKPDHLFLGTNADNVADRVSKGRSAVQRGEINRNSKLTAEQVAEIRATYRPGRPGRPSDPNAMTAAKLAARYGVTVSAVYHAYRGWSW